MKINGHRLFLKCVFLTTVLVAVDFFIPVSMKKSYSITEQKNGFDWAQYDSSVFERVSKSETHGSYNFPRMTLDMTFLPQHDDKKLKESIFLIKIFSYAGDRIIYQGPFRGRLILDLVPYDEQHVEITFWAFHSNSKTSLHWSSKHSSSVFSGQPLCVTLYDAYNKDADAWFRIDSKPENKGCSAHALSMTKQQALVLAHNAVIDLKIPGDEIVIQQDKTIEREFGWVFFATNRKYLDTSAAATRAG